MSDASINFGVIQNHDYYDDYYYYDYYYYYYYCNIQLPFCLNRIHCVT